MKAHTGAVGQAILYFGCRSPSEDFLYEADLKSFADDGTLDKLELAFSRQGSKKVYVQHILKEQVDCLPRSDNVDNEYATELFSIATAL